MSQKIVINVKSTITGKEDTLVKNSSFDVSSDGVLAAFNADMYDKYQVVAKNVYHVVDTFYIVTASQYAIGVLKKLNKHNATVDTLMFTARFK